MSDSKSKLECIECVGTGAPEAVEEMLGASHCKACEGTGNAPDKACVICGIENPIHFDHYAPFNESHHPYLTRKEAIARLQWLRDDTPDYRNVDARARHYQTSRVALLAGMNALQEVKNLQNILEEVKQACLFADDDGGIGVSEEAHIPLALFDRICAATCITKLRVET